GLGEDFAGVFGERRAARAGVAAAFRPSELEPPPGGEAAAAADVDAFSRCRLRSASARVAASSWPLRLVTSCSARAMAFARRAGGFGVETIGDWLEEHPAANRVVFSGHDPDFSDVVAELCDSTLIPMAKCALARLDLDDRRATAGTLRWLIPPDALKPEG